MNKNGILLDSYVIEAANNKWVVVDKGEGGRFTYVTLEGKLEMDSILTKCVSIINQTGEDINDTCSIIKSQTGRDITPNELVKEILISMLGTEVRLLAFLIAERDIDYKSILATMSENTKSNTRSKLSVVKKEKLDS